MCVWHKILHILWTFSHQLSIFFCCQLRLLVWASLPCTWLGSCTVLAQQAEVKPGGCVPSSPPSSSPSWSHSPEHVTTSITGKVRITRHHCSSDTYGFKAMTRSPVHFQMCWWDLSSVWPSRTYVTDSITQLSTTRTATDPSEWERQRLLHRNASRPTQATSCLCRNSNSDTL